MKLHMTVNDMLVQLSCTIYIYIYKICVTQNDPTIHPERFCNTCYGRISVAKTRGQNSITT